MCIYSKDQHTATTATATAHCFKTCKGLLDVCSQERAAGTFANLQGVLVAV